MIDLMWLSVEFSFVSSKCGQKHKERGLKQAKLIESRWKRKSAIRSLKFPAAKRQNRGGNMRHSELTYSLLAVMSSLGLVLGQVSTPSVGPMAALASPRVTDSLNGFNVPTSLTQRIVITSTDVPGTVTSGISNCTALNTSNCAVCSAGYFSNNGSLNCSCCSDGFCLAPEDCLSCPQGYYQSRTGQMTCLPCSKGTYTNSTGSTECQSCESGFYANETGSKLCRPCLPGYFSEMNATGCESCSRGLFCNATQCDKCTKCPGGEEALTTAATECTPCRPGMYKQPEDLLCKMCKTGYYQTLVGQESCDLCPEQHYCPSPDVAPIQCPVDAFCPPGSTAPQYCMETFFRKSGDHCVLTPLTIFLLVFLSLIILLITVIIFRRKKKVRQVDPVRSPLLRKEPFSGQEPHPPYGITWDREPVYAGW